MMSNTGIIEFELPFAFFLVSDADDFSDYMTWLIEMKNNLSVADYVCDLIGVQYGQHDGSLNVFFKEWYDMPSNYGEDISEALLKFKIRYRLET